MIDTCFFVSGDGYDGVWDNMSVCIGLGVSMYNMCVFTKYISVFIHYLESIIKTL
jgi:hypothetical protein